MQMYVHRSTDQPTDNTFPFHFRDTTILVGFATKKLRKMMRKPVESVSVSQSVSQPATE